MEGDDDHVEPISDNRAAPFLALLEGATILEVGCEGEDVVFFLNNGWYVSMRLVDPGLEFGRYGRDAQPDAP